MTARELMEYLQTFPPDAGVRMIAVNPSDRIIHDTQRIVCITNAPQPQIFLEVDGGEPFDAEAVEAAEDDERRAQDAEGKAPDTGF